MKNSVRLSKKNAASVLAQLQPLNQLLATASFELGYTVNVYPDWNMFKVTHKKQTHYIRHLRTPLNTLSAADNADNKITTNIILNEAGIPVPLQIKFTKDDLKQFRKTKKLPHGFSFPVVIKPSTATEKGTGVITNIRNARELLLYAPKQVQQYPNVILETYLPDWNDYRVLVLDNEVLGVVKRIPAYILGDGASTIQELIRRKNKERKKITTVKTGDICIDAELRHTLEEKKLTLQSIPKKDEYIRLKNVCNLGVGGELEEATTKIHPKNKQLAIQIAKAMRLRLVGIDFFCTDIAVPVTKKTGAILEVNEEPDISIHQMHTPGEGVKLARKIMKAIFVK